MARQKMVFPNEITELIWHTRLEFFNQTNDGELVSSDYFHGYNTALTDFKINFNDFVKLLNKEDIKEDIRHEG